MRAGKTKQVGQRITCSISAAVVVIQHPFPKSVKQNKAMSDPIQVKVFMGANQAVKAGKVVCEAVVEGGNSKAVKKDPTQLSNSLADVNTNNVAIFNNLVFPHGTRKKLIHLKFSVEVMGFNNFSQKKMLTMKVVSELTPPFIVKTNENQWEESEKILLKHEIFGAQSEAKWYQYVSYLFP